MTVLDSDHHLCDAVDEPPREPWYGTATVVIALTIAALIAVGIAVSAVLVVSREPVDPTGAVVPTIPITPTPPPMAPTMAPTSAPVPTQAPTRAPAIVPSALPPSPVQPSTSQPPPKPSTGSAAPTDNVSVGTGQIDWAAVLSTAQKVGVKYYFIEDETPAPLQCIPASLKYLRGLKL